MSPRKSESGSAGTWLGTLHRGPIARATVRTTLVLCLKLLAQAGSLVLLAQLLGPGRFASYVAMASLAVLFGAFATFGTHVTLLRDLSRDPDSREYSLSRAIGTTLACGSALFALFLPVALVLFADTRELVQIALCLGASELLVHPFLLLSTTQRQAEGRVALSQLLMVLPLLLRLAILIALWTIDTTDPLALYAAAHLATAVIATAFSIASLRHRWPGPSRWRLIARKDWGINAGFAMMMTTAHGPTELDKVLATKLLPPGAAGVYAAAARVVGASILPILSMMVSALPRLFSREHQGRLTKLIFAMSLLYGLMSCAALAALAPAISWAFGDDFNGLDELLLFMAFATPSLCLRIAATNILMAQAGPWSRVATEVMGMALLTVLALLLTPAWSTKGLIIAVIVAESLMAVYSWSCLFRITSKTMDPDATVPLPRTYEHEQN